MICFYLYSVSSTSFQHNFFFSYNFCHQRTNENEFIKKDKFFLLVCGGKKSLLINHNDRRECLVSTYYGIWFFSCWKFRKARAADETETVNRSQSLKSARRMKKEQQRSGEKFMKRQEWERGKNKHENVDEMYFFSSKTAVELRAQVHIFFL